MIDYETRGDRLDEPSAWRAHYDADAKCCGCG